MLNPDGSFLDHVLRFLAIFLALALSLFAAELTPPAQRWIVEPWTEAVARAAAFAITSFDTSVIASGRQLLDRLTGQGVSIEAGCNGLEAMILLAAAMLAFPASWARRLGGIALGGIAVQALNLVRIATLFYLSRWNAAAFEWTHLYLWQPLIMVDVLVVWLVWLRWARKEPRAA
jgi:exosortase H (IPTLxxWG-CTERM-specific)